MNNLLKGADEFMRLSIVASAISLSVVNLATAENALAQESNSASTALEEIIVTAQRRDERLDKVPISLTALSQETMNDFHIVTLSDLATIVPGLAAPIGNVQDSADIAIRGIFSNGNAPTTQLYIDETPIAIRTMIGAGFSSSPRPFIFDLERVEVLRGPQGTLFGSSAMGGAIRYITPQPSLSQASGYTRAEFSYTERGDANYEVGVAYGAPIVNGTAGFRVSAWMKSDGGFIDKENPFTGGITQHNANSSNTYVIRPAFTWAPVEGLTITPSLFLQRLQTHSSDSYWLNKLPYIESGAHASGSILEPQTDDLKVTGVAIKYALSSVTLQSDTSYLDRVARTIDDFTHGTESIYSGFVGPSTEFIPGVPESYKNYFIDNTSTKAWQQEFRITSNDPSARIKWLVGAFYRHSVQTLQQTLPGSLDPITEALAGEDTLTFTGFPLVTLPDGSVANSYTNFHTTDISEALFGQLDIELAPRLKANIGARVEHSVVKDQSQTAAGPLSFQNYNTKLLPDETANPVTPKVGLTYQYTNDGMVYITAAKGYRAGGGNSPTATGNSACGPSLKALGFSAAPAAFGPDSLWSYEIGTKNSFFDRRLAIQASAFYINWTNIQTQLSLPSCAESITINLGKAVSKGFDLQVAAVVMAGLKVGANVAYTDAYQPNAAFGAPSQNPDGTFGPAPLLNAKGDKLAGVNPWTASANLDYSRAVDSWWSDANAYIRIDYRWLDAGSPYDPNVAGYNPFVVRDETYSVLNLRFGMRHEGLDLSVFVNNSTHSDPLLGQGNSTYSSTPLLNAVAIRPFTAGLTAQYRF